MNGGGGTRTETVASNTEPWAEQKPYLLEGFGRAKGDVLNQPIEYFEDGVVPYSPYSEQAIEGIAERGAGGSQLTNWAQTDLTGTLRGDYLKEGNPYLGAVADDVAAEVLPRVNAQFASAGRSGQSPLAQATAATEMTRALAPYQFGAYADERGRQMQAAGLAPQLAGEDYRDLQALQAAGGMQEAKDRELLDDRMRQFYFEQEEPQKRLEQYMRLISGGYGGTTVGDELVPTGNPLMQGLGLALSGAGVAGGLGWQPFG